MKTANIIRENLILGGEVTIDEISLIIRDLKLRKAPGIDFIQNEHVIHGGLELKLCILHLFNSLIKLAKFPILGKKTKSSLYTKGATNQRNSQTVRPIALLPCFF